MALQGKLSDFMLEILHRRWAFWGDKREVCSCTNYWVSQLYSKSFTMSGHTKSFLKAHSNLGQSGVKSCELNFIHFVQQIFHTINHPHIGLGVMNNVNNECRTFETGYTRREIFQIFSKNNKGFEDYLKIIWVHKDVFHKDAKAPLSHFRLFCAVHISWKPSFFHERLGVLGKLGPWTMLVRQIVDMARRRAKYEFFEFV